MLVRQKRAITAFFGGMMVLLGIMSLKGAIEMKIISLVSAPVFIIIGAILFWYAYSQM